MIIDRIAAKSLLAALVAFPMGAYAGTTVDINFSSLSQPGSTYTAVGSTTTQDGVTVTGTDLYVWEASSPNLPSLSAADTSLFDFYVSTPDTITAGGAEFTMNSIDLAPLIADGDGTFDVEFTGTFADSSTTSQTFTVNDTPDALQQFDFSGFTNLVSVSFTQGTNSGFFAGQDTAYQFDDVDATVPGSNAATPEPGSALLFASGLVGLAGMARPRKGKQA
jgi:hypothetical protein